MRSIEEKLHLLNDATPTLEMESDLDLIADSIVKKIVAKESDSRESAEKRSPQQKPVDRDYVSVDLDSLENSDVRSFGGEAVCLDMIRQLCLPDKLGEWGFNRKQRALAIGSIVSRLLKPGSERSSFNWLQNTSSLGELIDFDYRDSSLSRFYEIADLLYAKKRALEEWLYQTECRLFTLEESIVLYDLTNTFFEGTGKYNLKARFGRSKEKRSDAPLVTMGLVLDGQGFPRKSATLAGNVIEPSTLESMLKELVGYNGETRERIVVMDAGIASEDNLAWLRSKGFVYVVVARNNVEMPVCSGRRREKGCFGKVG